MGEFGQSDHRGDPCDDVAVHHVLGGNPLQTVYETLQIAQTVLACLQFVDNAHDPALEGVVALPVGDRYYFAPVQPPVGFADLAVRRCQILG